MCIMADDKHIMLMPLLFPMGMGRIYTNMEEGPPVIYCPVSDLWGRLISLCVLF